MATPHSIPRNSRFQDLTGRHFGRWIVLFYAGRGPGFSLWGCRCECGTERVIPAGSLKRGLSASCGCRGLQFRKKDFPAEWAAWQSMKTRCLNPNYQGTHNYAGRGIHICQEWISSFSTFFEHVGRRPSTAHTLGRIDNEKGYEPGNVCWALMAEQALNKRTNRLVLFAGETMPLAEACRRADLNYGMVCGRLRSAWSVEDALSRPKWNGWSIEDACTP